MAITGCMLGVGCKEVMVTAPVVVFLYDWVFFSMGSMKGLLLRRWRLYAGLSAAWPIMILILSYAKPTSDMPSSYALVYLWKGISPLLYAATQFDVILHYLKLAVWPTGLSFDYRWTIPDNPTHILLSGAAIAVMVALSSVAVLRRYPWGFTWAWFFIILAPTSSLVPRPEPIAEYRMYLPLAGLAVFAVVLMHEGLSGVVTRMVAAGKSGRRVCIVIGCCLVMAVLASLVLLTRSRNRVYESDETLWRSVVSSQPENLRAYVGLGAALLSAAKYEEAKECFLATLVKCPVISETSSRYLRVVYSITHNNMGILYFTKGDYEEAALHFKEALRVMPLCEDFRSNLARALAAGPEMNRQ